MHYVMWTSSMGIMKLSDFIKLLQSLYSSFFWTITKDAFGAYVICEFRIVIVHSDLKKFFVISTALVSPIENSVISFLSCSKSDN